MTLHKLMSAADIRRAFIHTFNQTARYHHRHKVFEDLVRCAAITVHNQLSGAYSDTLEQEYLQTMKQYQREDVMQLSSLFALMVRAFQLETCDFLGSLFMDLNLGDKYRGQFFTPASVCRLMAQLQCGDLPAQLATRPFITASEPCCGAGGMMLALADGVREAGFDPAQHLWVSCTDVDPVAASMAYIQLSLAGIPGEVVTGNVLTNERRRVMYTPAHWQGNWSSKLMAA